MQKSRFFTIIIIEGVLFRARRSRPELMSDRASEQDPTPLLSDEMIIWINQDFACYICEEKNIKALMIVEIAESGKDALVCPACHYVGTSLFDFENTHILDVKNEFPNL